MKDEKRKNTSKSDRLLFVIPAYNEALNISPVLKEIKEEFKNCDIVVINDCSKDNTKEVVQEQGVKCITMPFNVNYAMAVQTGIKYAFENDYDFVIQIDADGQHIPSEAHKMLKKMAETNCDIVIGSRFLEKTDYPHPLFRRLGTSIFKTMVRVLCGKKVTDPTSGFQCLNRQIIARYSMMGKYPEFPDANLIIEVLYEGYKIEEVPVQMRTREIGESMHGGIIKPIKYMIKVFYSILIVAIRNLGRVGK